MTIVCAREDREKTRNGHGALEHHKRPEVLLGIVQEDNSRAEKDV